MNRHSWWTSRARCVATSLLLLLVTCAAAAAQATKPPRAHGVLVMLEDGAVTPPYDKTAGALSEWKFRDAGVEQLLAKYGVTRVEKSFPTFTKADTLGVAARTHQVVRLADFSNVHTLTLPTDQDVHALAQELSQLPGVVYAEVGARPEHLTITPNDPSFPLQWGLNNIGQTGGNNDADVDAPEAWDLGTGATSEIIGVVDGGVENSHADLSGKVSGDAGWGWGGHGFHVAGIAAAKTNNAVGVAGVDWLAQIVSQRIDNAPTNNNSSYDAHVASAINDAVNAGADVLNNSWRLLDVVTGTPRSSLTVRSAFANAYKLNRVACVAMGNDGGAVVEYPAAFGQGIVAVGATDHRDVPATFTTTGSHIDVAAPGVSIYSTVPYGNGYDYMSGTSMATPHVAGLAALMWSVKPDLLNDDIEQLLRKSADDVSTPGFDNATGAGRINARRALEYLRPPYALLGQSAVGGTDQGYTTVTMNFLSVPGLAAGTYFTRRHEVRRAVTFPTVFTTTPTVWGRGLASTGYSFENPNHGMPWCEPVAGTVTNTGCTMRTVTYEVFDAQGRRLGWYPAAPASVVFGYALHGPVAPLAASISGPSALNTGQVGTWNASVSGGLGSYAYQWYHRATPADLWTPVSTSASYTRTMQSADFQLMLQVTSGAETVASTLCVSWGLAPTVAISGPRALVPSTVGNFTASASGGAACGSYAYAWKYRTPPGIGAWSAVVATTPTYSHTMLNDVDVELQCTVTGNTAVVDTHYVDAPPAAVANLAVALAQFSGIVSWWAPGDDGLTGQVVSYDLRYSPLPITPANFASAQSLGTQPPQPAGTQECAEVTELAACSPYYFAIRSLDSNGNWSPISNVANGTTRCKPGVMFLCDGGFSPATNLEPMRDLPTTVELGALAPQPMRGEGMLRFGVPADHEGRPMNLSLFDVLGRRVRMLLDGPAVPGYHQVRVPARGTEGAPLSGGVYFLRLTIGGTTRTRSIVVLD